jgi:rifampicin phosphotransferase
VAHSLVVAVEQADCVIDLGQVGAADGALVGGKGANLGELLRSGFAVPVGFCVTTAAFRRFLVESGVGEFVRAALSALDLLQPSQVGAVAARLRERMAAAAIPVAVEQAIMDAWRVKWAGREDVALAVRSSATAEDLPTASFAGQQDTFLNVMGREALLRAVRDCWASLYTERAILYRARNRIDHGRVAMAVVVQEMVPAECAGVAFTADPVDSGPRRDSRIIIEAVAGLGELLVSGRVSPDRLVLDKETLAILEQSAGGAPASTVADGSDRKVCLTAAQARAMGELARQVEQLFGVPQDIEWALAGDRLWLLQARPITTLAAAAPADTDRTVWSNVNVGELMPEVATPMAWALVQRMVEQVFAPIMKVLGIDLSREPWLALIAGRIYANLSVFARLIAGLPGMSRMNLTEAFGGHEAAAAELEHLLRHPPKAGRWRWRMALLGRLPLWSIWILGHMRVRSGEAAVAAYGTKAKHFAGTDVGGLSNEGLQAFFGTVLSALHGETTTTARHAIVHIGVGMAFTKAFLKATGRWFGDEHGAIANRLISGAGEMASAEAALELWQLADWVHQRPALVDLLAGMGDEVLLVHLAETAEGREFLRRWEQWKDLHGHHAYAELDVAQPRWSERPGYVLAMIRGYLTTPAQAAPPVLARQRKAERVRLWAECRSRLRWWRRPLFGFLLRRARAGLVLRENLKSEVIRVLAVVRRTLLEIGRRLTERGVLRVTDDVFFLEPAEVDRQLSGQHDPNISATIAARRAEFVRCQRLRPPPVIIGQFDPDRTDSRAGVPVTTADGQNVLRGLAVSAGVATGPARVILRADGTEVVRPGEVLVAPFTDPGWTPYFLTAAALVVDMGGLFSHGSVVAREYGLPAVVNVGLATQRIRTGQMITVDGNRGLVVIGEGGPQ